MRKVIVILACLAPHPALACNGAFGCQYDGTPLGQWSDWHYGNGRGGVASSPEDMNEPPSRSSSYGETEESPRGLYGRPLDCPDGSTCSR